MRYDQFQAVFALSSLANWVSKQTGTVQQLQADYQKVLLATLASAPAQTAIGAWELVWGPQVWQDKDSHRSDNAMFVARIRSLGDLGDVYVVAIAATNPLSPYDWTTEDFDVSKVVDFSTYDPTASTPPAQLMDPTASTVGISMGTALGVWHLLTMVSPPSGRAPGTTLDGFLKTVAGTGASVIFTGHSLGGALSPTMATWFKSTHRLDACKAVYCYPTAGATPGNAAFAALCTATLPPTSGNGYRVWNRDLWNAYDVVPHAWELTMLAQVGTLYDNKPFALIDFAVEMAVNSATSSRIAYAQIANQKLAGTLSGVPTTSLAFMTQAAAQHTTAYSALIAYPLTPVAPPAQERLTAEIDTDAELYALLARLEADRRAATTASP